MDATESEDILVDVSDGIATLTLNRPASLNAMTPDLMNSLKEAVQAAQNDPAVRVLLITGAGKAFSSGGDRNFLDGLTRASPFEIKDTVYASFQGAVKAVHLCPKPTVAAVNGAAVGAGCELAVACDFRVASSRARFIESWVHLGVIAPLGGMFLLPRIVGLARATEMLMLGTPVDAEEARRIGLANEVVPVDDLARAGRALAARLAAGPPLALGVFKEGLRRSAETTLAAEWEAGLYAQSLLIGSQDFREAVLASAQKRPPRFVGR